MGMKRLTRGRIETHLLSDSHDIVWKLADELVGFMSVDAPSWETVAETCAVVEITRVDEKKVDIFFL